MTSGFHLAAVIGGADAFWPHLHAILHWHRQAGPLLRLVLLHPASGQPTATLLERVTRTACPGVRVERRELPVAPDALLAEVTACRREFSDAPWTVQVPGPLPLSGWGLAELVGQPDCRILQRQEDGDWVELRRQDPGTGIVSETLPAFRREVSDEIAIADLVRAQTQDTPNPAPLIATPAKPLPLVPLAQAAMACSWDWKAAFAQAAPESAGDPAPILLQRFLAAFLLDLGISQVVLGSRKPRHAPAAASPGSPEPSLWVHQGGRLVVLDTRLDHPASASETAEPSEPALSPLASTLLRAAEERRDLGPLAPEWVLVRPCQVLHPMEQALAEAHGIRVFDEAACRDLPARLAGLFGLPLSADAVEIERRLRVHLAETGRSRVFGPESQVLQQQRAAASDPAIVNADGLLEQIQRARGQNWLLWVHHDRVHLRVPAEGRSSASGDWKAMLAAFVGLDPALVQTRQTQRVVLLDFPESQDHRRRVADWLRPFLNASLTFDTARARFAAEARVSAEAENAARASGRTPAPSAPNPAASGTTLGAGRPAKPVPSPKPAPPRPASTPSPGPRRMQKVSLEDLDRALDSALTLPPGPTSEDTPKKP